MEMVFSAGTPNHNEAFWLEMQYERRVSRTLAVIVSKIAEDLGGRPVDGDDEWSMEALMARRLNRGAVIILSSEPRERIPGLDFGQFRFLPASGPFFTIMWPRPRSRPGTWNCNAAPNAGLTAKRGRNGWLPVDDKAWPFHRRTIVFFRGF